MNKLIYFIMILFVIQNLSSQTIVWSENFSNGCASGCLLSSGWNGWTEVTTGTNGTKSNKWFISGAECGMSPTQCGTSCGGANPTLHIGADDGFSLDPGAAYNAGGGGLNTTTNRMAVSPPINCTGYSNLVLSFDFIHNGQPGSDECSVQYSSNNGATWTTLGVLPRTVGICSPQGFWTQYSIDLPSTANNNPNVKIGLNWKNNNDGTGTAPSVAIDNIVISTKPSYCYNSAFAAYTSAGCTSNCILTEFASLTNPCSSSSGCGSCPSTGPISTMYFNIPSGCTATLTASFQRRCNGIGCSNCHNPCNNMSASAGCCNSGMDANDYLKVGGSTTPTYSATINFSDGYTTICGSSSASTSFASSGNTITATGNNNGGAVIQWAQTGGVLYLEQRSNRADEIVTYTLAIQPGCNCTDIVLPVDILSFWAEPDKYHIKLQWLVKNEKNLSHYRIEKSKDGLSFYEIATIPSENSYSEKIYSMIDDNPYEGISYYKLITVDKSLNDEKYIMRDVLFQLEYQPFRYEINNDYIILRFQDNTSSSFSITDITGKNILHIDPINQTEYRIGKELLSSGVYVAQYFNGKKYAYYKIILP